VTSPVEVRVPAGDGDVKSVSPAAAVEGWTPTSPERPRRDPEHDTRASRAIARALRDIPFYQRRPGDPNGASLESAGGAPLGDVLSRLPPLSKKDVRATLNKQWVPAGRDVRVDLESGALELVETSGSTGERMRILWDAGWWPRQEARAMRTNAFVAETMDGKRGAYREAVLTTPACGLGTCHIGDIPYEERVQDYLLFLNQRSDPMFWTADEQTRMLDELGKHGTLGLESDPLYLALLARFAREHGRTLDVRGYVQLTYAFTTRAHLRAIRQAYAGPVLQLYGASDVGVLFMEGDDRLLHHAPFTTHVELLRARVPTPGATDVALVLATSLDRVAMPLVRYVVGDLVQVETAGPRRWTSVPPLASVEGRVDDALVRPDGALVTAGALDRAIGAVEGLRLWQVNQRTPDGVDVDVVVEGDAARTVEETRARLAPLLEGLAVAVRTATALPIEASGKFRVSKRHFPLDLPRAFEGL
jgi:phenylacetate-coenzyme A ligase PaaK-like adenylate-forming protein